ncbi:aspartic peptidase domain-containing protein [Microdochium bolleyi]|uniref:Aspartic peptidase domain-containing protein n=1 Tax=Microdochium bolleyi TaxID=196109 RepID=A0A136IRS2_9PEZI|nr:aspartic peptidase domain-containing protein [Microdochium bolleyi]
MPFTSTLGRVLAILPAVSAAVIDLPLHIQDSYISAQFQVGTPAKPFRFFIDTGSATSWVTSASCNSTSCPNLSSYTRVGYNVSASSTSVDLHTPARIEYTGGDALTGNVVQDVFHDEKGMLPDYWNQTFLEVNHSSWRFITADGFGGFSFSSIAEPNTTTIMETLLWDGRLDDPRFSLFYGTSLANDGAQDGILTLGGSHEDKYVDGEMLYVPLRKETPYQLWRTRLLSINVLVAGGANSTIVWNHGKAPTTTDPAGTEPAANKTVSFAAYNADYARVVFDTGAGRISLPEDAMLDVYSALGWDYYALLQGQQRWTCAASNSSWALSLTIGDPDVESGVYTFTQRGDEVYIPGDQCQPPFDGSGVQGFGLIGAAFLRRFYSVYDFGADKVEDYKPRIGFGRLKKEYDYLHQ